MKHIFFYIMWITGWVTYTGKTCTTMYYGKKVSWQWCCDASRNVLLVNLGSCHPCGCYFDMYHLALLQTIYTILWKQHSVIAVTSFSWIMCSVTKKNGWGAEQWFWGVNLDSKLARSQTNQAAVGCAGQATLNHRALTLQLKGQIPQQAAVKRNKLKTE